MPGRFAFANILCVLVASHLLEGCADVAVSLDPACMGDRVWSPSPSFVAIAPKTAPYPALLLSGARLLVVQSTLLSVNLETGQSTEVVPARPGVSIALMDAVGDWNLTMEWSGRDDTLRWRSSGDLRDLPSSANWLAYGQRFLSPNFGAVYRTSAGLFQQRPDGTSQVHPLPAGAERVGADAGERRVAIGIVGGGTGQVLAFDGERLREVDPTSVDLGWVRAVGDFVYWQDQGGLFRRGDSGPTVMVEPCGLGWVRAGEESLAVACDSLRVYRGDQRVWSRAVEGQVMGVGVSEGHVAWIESDPWSGEGPRLGTLYVARLGTEVVVPVQRLRLSSEIDPSDYGVQVSDTHVAWEERDGVTVGYLALPPEQVLGCGAEVALPPDSTLLD